MFLKYITIEELEVSGIEQSVRDSGLPKSFSTSAPLYHSDWERALKLSGASSGSGHDCFLKGINVRFRITAPQYWWLQAERYHWFDIVSSQSKMHMLTNMNLEILEDNVNEWVEQDTLLRLSQAILAYNNFDEIAKPFLDEKVVSFPMTDMLFDREELFRYILSNVPMGLKLAAGITTNYLQLKTIYSQRKNHRLLEWKEFCEFVESLPYSNWITGKED